MNIRFLAVAFMGAMVLCVSLSCANEESILDTTPFVAPINYSDVATLESSEIEPGDLFAADVAIHEDVIIVGAPREDSGSSNSGAAYIFQRDQGGIENWGEVMQLTAFDGYAEDQFGYSVALRDDIAVVGAPFADSVALDAGAAYVFYRDQGGAGNWGLVKKLLASDPHEELLFAKSLDLSDGTLAVGATHDNEGGESAGAVYVFEQDLGGADNWGEAAKIVATDSQEGDILGTSVSVSGDIIAAGAMGAESEGFMIGALLVFYRDASCDDCWGQVARVFPEDGLIYDWFGASISVNGDTIFVGAPGRDSGIQDCGAVYVYNRNQGGNDTWGQAMTIWSDESMDNGQFGYSLASDGELLAVGAPGEWGTGFYSGVVYLYRRDEGGADNWGKILDLNPADGEDLDLLGVSVDLQGKTLVSGANSEFASGEGPGKAHVFYLSPEGDECLEASDCPDVYCVDGVCCNTECGNSDPNDCQACSVEQGADVNGICAILDGDPCDDGDSATFNDHCDNGICVGSSDTDAPPDSGPEDDAGTETGADQGCACYAVGNSDPIPSLLYLVFASLPSA